MLWEGGTTPVKSATMGANVLILPAMDVDSASAGRAAEQNAGRRHAAWTNDALLDRPADLRLEDGTALQVNTAPRNYLPLGYHDLFPLDGGPMARLIVSSSRRCYLPEHWRSWGWAVQLYARRSAESWGIGDLLDLQRLAHWSATDLGAGILLINPLNAATRCSRKSLAHISPAVDAIGIYYMCISNSASANQAGERPYSILPKPAEHSMTVARSIAMPSSPENARARASWLVLGAI